MGYAHSQKGSLKLKGGSDISHKKKKKDKDKERDLKKRLQLLATTDSAGSSDERPRVERDLLTPAQRKFKETKERRDKKELLEKAQKGHKERIMEFNQKLDNLTEHFDIPKVSWTK